MPPLPRRMVLLAAAATLCSVLEFPAAAADTPRFIRIGTGPTGGTYFPVGGLIANVLSNPPGSLSCELGGSCGVPGLIAAAVTSQGSIENVANLAAGSVDLAIAQADVVRKAFAALGSFAGKPPLVKLRAIANLFPESLHIVVRREATVTSPAALRHKRVSLGERDSGTLATAATVLNAYGLAPKDMQASYEKLTRAAAALAASEVDAFFMVAGYPVEAIARLADSIAIRLLPVTGDIAQTILKAEPTLAAATIPAGTYIGVPATPTLGPRALLLSSLDMPSELAYAITKALWDPRNRKLLNSGHPEGRHVQLASALDGLTVPLHPGAARYYRDAGMSPPGDL
jgi:TRAP transporter TAXI family solute receptor